MASLKLMVLSWVIVLASSHKVSNTEMRELLAASMQNTISLTTLVAQQTQKISDITNFVDDAKEEITDLKRKLKAAEEKQAASEIEIQAIKNNSSELESRLEASEEKFANDIQDLETKLEATEGELAAAEEDIQAIKNNSSELESRLEASEDEIQAMKNNSSELESRLEASEDKFQVTKNNSSELESRLEASEEKFDNKIQELKESIADSNNGAVIVSAEGGLGDSNCVKVCAGSTPRGSTNWQDDSSWLYVDVKISECGFVTVPTVTTSLEGISFDFDQGSARIYDTTTDKFRVLIETTSSSSDANNGKWNVDWVAVGYTC